MSNKTKKNRKSNCQYIIAIPSYKRAELCNNKTLKMLHENKIDKNLIYVYVANKEEYEDYKKILDPSHYHKIVLGIIGVTQQRQFISEQWKEGTNIIYLDDDVEKVDLSLSKKYNGKSLHSFFCDAFKTCREKGSYIWGIYPVYNPFFREPRPEIVSDHLVFIIGAFYGIINRPKLKSLHIPSHNSQKDDVERSIKYFQEDGIVVRFDKIGFQTKYFNVGGLGDLESRIKPSKIVSEYLQNEYPEYGKIWTRKKGTYEFRLNRLPSFSKKNKTRKNI